MTPAKLGDTVYFNWYSPPFTEFKVSVCSICLTSPEMVAEYNSGLMLKRLNYKHYPKHYPNPDALSLLRYC